MAPFKLFANDLRFKHIGELLDKGPVVWHEGAIPCMDSRGNLRMDYHNASLDDFVWLFNEDHNWYDELPHYRFRIASYATFHSVREALERIGVEQLLPGITSIDEAMSFYIKDGKAAENEKEYGFVVLGLIHPTHDARYDCKPVSEDELCWAP